MINTENIKLDMVTEFLLESLRNSMEDLHAGTVPSSKTGDYSDVKVVSPYGEILWKDLSRISNREMGELKDEMRYVIKRELPNAIKMMLMKGELDFGAVKIDAKIYMKKFLEQVT